MMSFCIEGSISILLLIKLDVMALGSSLPCSIRLFSLGLFECRVRPRLHGHTDQCGDQDRWVQLPDQRFCRGQRARKAVDRIRVAVRYGRKSFKAEIDQA